MSYSKYKVIDLFFKREMHGLGDNRFVPQYSVDVVLHYDRTYLKEGILELALNRMYGLIIQNLGGIVGEIRKEIFNI